MQYKRVRIGVAAPTEGPGNCRGDAAAHRPGRQHLHHHVERKDERNPSQGIGAEPRHPPGLDEPGRGHHQHHGDVGPGQAQQGRKNRRLEQDTGARVDGARRTRALRDDRLGLAVHPGHAVGFPFELFRHMQPRLRDGRVSGALREHAVPERELA